MTVLVQQVSRLRPLKHVSKLSRCFVSTDEKSSSLNKPSRPSQVVKSTLPDENPDVPKTCVFQQLTKSQSPNPIYTLEQAAVFEPMENLTIYFRYPSLGHQRAGRYYYLRGVENQDTYINHFPDSTDLLMIGSGLIGSATAYYLKKELSLTSDVLVLDKDPYSPHNCTALCNGLISTQSKSQDISRLASITKELIRNLQYDVLVTKEDFAQIKYRPCTHLILWSEQDNIDQVLKSIEFQNEDGIFTIAKTPKELEATFPWLKATGSDIVIGTHGNQDEALVDPIGLRNLYRTLAQAHGANFIQAEVIDFNTIYHKDVREIMPNSAGAVVAKMPATGELRSMGFLYTLLCLGHNTPYLECRSEMDSYMRDPIEDLHFLQPRLRIYFSFHSLSTPVVGFPVITDVDGSILIRDDYAGNFKYFLTYDESEPFFESDRHMFMNSDSDDPYTNLMHRSKLFIDYFDQVLKPRLVNRIPTMEDAKFNLAYSGFESRNLHDGCPVMGPHPYHSKLYLSGGYGSRMMTFGPAVALTIKELMLAGEEETLDVTNFYWNRVFKDGKVNEFDKLIR